MEHVGGRLFEFGEFGGILEKKGPEHFVLLKHNVEELIMMFKMVRYNIYIFIFLLHWSFYFIPFLIPHSPLPIIFNLLLLFLFWHDSNHQTHGQHEAEHP